MELTAPCLQCSRCLVADAAFSCGSFIIRLLERGWSIIGALKTANQVSPRPELHRVHLDRGQSSLQHAELHFLRRSRVVVTAAGWVASHDSGSSAASGNCSKSSKVLVRTHEDYDIPKDSNNACTFSA